MKKELTQIKHARSAKEFPEIELEENEYVVLHIKRAYVGIVLIWSTVGAIVLALSILLIIIASTPSFTSTAFVINERSLGYLRLAILAIYAIVIFGGFISHSIYDQNQLYITNFRAIQKTRTSLFANSTNVIKLSRVEDVSYHQKTIFDHIFKIGTLRMSTVGDETTYTFPWLDTPNDEVNTISHLVYENKHSFRPAEDTK
ncbi:PH domain-containing protein [Candidatus Saccharibacteria bacterium]|nr:PH domain-containing protein [Candidatus Saccharibacteria bacterium]